MPEQDFRIKDSDAGLTIVRKTHAGTNPERHFHESYELLYIVSGERTFFYGSKTFHIKTGEFLCVRPGILHRALNRAGESCELINVYFDDPANHFFPTIRPLLDACGTLDEPVIPVSEIDRYRLMAAFQSVARELSERNLGYIPMTWGILFQSITELSRVLPLPSTSQPVIPMNATATRMIAYLSEHFRENLTLPRMATHFGLSESYLSRMFRQVTRFGFLEYLTILRIQESCKLLSSTTFSVGLISERCGFGSVTQFGRCFRRITGYSPLSWRKSMANY